MLLLGIYRFVNKAPRDIERTECQRVVYTRESGPRKGEARGEKIGSDIIDVKPMILLSVAHLSQNRGCVSAIELKLLRMVAGRAADLEAQAVDQVRLPSEINLHDRIESN